MFAFISIIVCLLSLYYLGSMVSAYSLNSDYTMPAVVLLIYSLVAIIREVKLNDEEFYNTNNIHRSNSNWRSGDYYDYNTPAARNVTNAYRTVETFKNDKKEREKEDRPMVLHYPSKKEAREKVAELEKSWWWRVKRSVAAFFSFDITAKYYEPRYVKQEVAVKGKEDNSRFMPKNLPNGTLVKCTYNDAEYDRVAKFIGRSFDVAMDGEEFVLDEDIITVEDEDKSEPATSSATVIDFRGANN